MNEVSNNCIGNQYYMVLRTNEGAIYFISKVKDLVYARHPYDEIYGSVGSEHGLSCLETKRWLVAKMGLLNEICD